MIKVLTITCVVLLVSYAALGQPKFVEKITRTGKELVIPYEKYLLGNGLTLIIHEDHSDPIAHVNVTYHVGSAREQIGKSGFAHFYEHMMFMGSENAPEKLYDQVVEGNGGSGDGSTNRDLTRYYETVPKNVLETVLWMEADRMGFLLNAVTQQKFEVQRATVKNERGQNYDNRPYGLEYENVDKNLYPYGHPYSWATIGYIKDMDSSNLNDLKNFFLRWYVPNNATLTIAGDVVSADVVKMVEKYFGPIPRGPEAKPVPVSPVQLAADRYVSYTDNFAKLPMLSIVYPTVPEYHKDIVPLEVLSEILGWENTSVLYQQMIKKEIALEANSYNDRSELAGQFTFRITPVAGKSLQEVERAFRSALDSFEIRGVTDDDIAKFKGLYKSWLLDELQTVAGKASRLANFQTFTGNPNKIGELIKSYDAVTKEDVLRVYNTYIKGKGAVVLSIVTKRGDSLMARKSNYTIDSSGYTAPDYGYSGLTYTRHADNFDRLKVPASGTAPVLKIPTIWKKALPNGTKVAGAEIDEIPVVFVQINIPGGQLAQASNISKAGLSVLFAQMLNEDTKNYTAEQMTIELQKLGSEVYVTSEIDRIAILVRSLKNNVDKTLSLVQEKLFNPLFPEAAFKRIKNQALDGLKVKKSQPAFLADAVSLRLNYGNNNIMGIPSDGTEETIRNITIDDIKSYYRDYITSQNTSIVVTGDIKEEEIVPMVSFISKLPSKKIELQEVRIPPPAGKGKVYLVDVPTSTQTEFRIGYATGLKYDATGEYYKSTLMNHPLGQLFTSRLNQYLRETKGWTYVARSHMSGNQYTGDFRFYAGIRADVTDSALKYITGEFNHYVADGPTEAEMRFTKKAVVQNEVLRYENLYAKGGFIRNIVDYNLSPDYLQKQHDILNKITAADLKSTAAKILNPDKLNILLVADKTKVLEGLKKSGYQVIELDADGNVKSKRAF